MNVNGQEFMRNVSIEQDKADLASQQDKLDQQKRQSVEKESNYFESNNIDDNSAYVDISIKTPSNEDVTDDRIKDIKLISDNGSKNKKKYIILGLALILLFIITIVVVRIVSNNNKESQLSIPIEKPQEIDKDKILDKINSSDEYQKVIEENEKLSNKKIQKKELKEIILPEATKEKPLIAIEKSKPKIEPKRDLFGLNNFETIPKTIESKVIPKIEAPIKQIKKKVIPKVTTPKKQIILPPAKEINFVKKTSKVAGYYIQIGAFTKKPSDKLLNSIKAKGYRYTVHTMKIKGKIYNKVLIGSYSKKILAQQVINKVKKDFNNKNAYILKF